MTVAEIIYKTGGTTNSDVLSGNLDMNLIGNELGIVLTNISTGIASPKAPHNLLSGVGFVLPEDISINGGSAIITSCSTAINFTAPAGENISGQCGY